MEHGYSTKRVVITGITLAALTISVPFLANRLKARRSNPFSPTQETRRSSAKTEEFYGFVESLPSYRALQASLEDLATDTTKVLKAAAKNDAESLSLVVHDYRTSLREASGNFAMLSDRIGRHRAEAAFEELVVMEMESDLRLDELILPKTTQE